MGITGDHFRGYLPYLARLHILDKDWHVQIQQMQGSSTTVREKCWENIGKELNFTWEIPGGLLKAKFEQILKYISEKEKKKHFRQPEHVEQVWSKHQNYLESLLKWTWLSPTFWVSNSVSSEQRGWRGAEGWRKFAFRAMLIPLVQRPHLKKFQHEQPLT